MGSCAAPAVAAGAAPRKLVLTLTLLCTGFAPAACTAPFTARPELGRAAASASSAGRPTQVSASSRCCTSCSQRFFGLVHDLMTRTRTNSVPPMCRTRTCHLHGTLHSPPRTRQDSSRPQQRRPTHAGPYEQPQLRVLLPERAHLSRRPAAHWRALWWQTRRAPLSISKASETPPLASHRPSQGPRTQQQLLRCSTRTALPGMNASLFTEQNSAGLRLGADSC